MSFNRELSKLVKEAVGEELKVYLDGLISIKNKSKQVILKKALKKMKKNRYELAIGQFQEYTKKFALEDNEKCSILNLTGLSQYEKGENKKAKNTFQEIILIAEKIKEYEALSAAKGNLGNVYLVLGEYKKALGYHQEALKIDRRMGDPKGEAIDLDNIGLSYRVLGEYKKALKYHQEALKIDRRIRNPRAEAVVLNNLGNVYLVLGDSKKALESYQGALKIDRRIGNPRNEAFTLFNIGVTLLSLESHEKALNFFIKAREKFSFLGLIKLVREVDRNIDVVSNHLNNKVLKKLH
jgi:tetratricopeptide (TPR) repeat protein